MKTLERLFDPLMWAWCALAYHTFMALPSGPVNGPTAEWLLPFAGYYAYHERGSGTSWRWSERVRA